MYQIPGDILTTYDPSATEEHLDSSDFEGDIPPNVSRFISKNSLLDNNLKKKTKTFNYFINQQIFNRHNNIDDDTKHAIDTWESLWKEETVHTSKFFNKHKKEKKNRAKSQDLNRSNQVNLDQPKAMLRHKVLPCGPSVIRRYGNKVKHIMSVIKETMPENVTRDNGCQAHRGKKGTKKYRREQCYAIQPVYAVKGMYGASAPNPYQHNKMTKDHIVYNQQSKNLRSNTTMSLSSTDVTVEEKKVELNAHKKFIKTLISEIKYEYLHKKYVQKNEEQQYPSKHNNEIPYQVFASPCQQETKDCCTSADSDTVTDMASSPQFWDFICDKIYKKYQLARLDTLRSCTYLNNQLPQNQLPDNKLPQNQLPNNNLPQNQRPFVTSNCKRYRVEGSCTNSPGRNSPKPPTPKPSTVFPNVGFNKDDLSVYKLNLLQSNNKNVMTDIFECPCFSQKHKKPFRDSASTSTDQITKAYPDNSKSCQQSQYPITADLAQNYKDKVLCIHNPPCVLINGCVNLPNTNEDSPWVRVDENPSYISKKNQYSQQYNYSEQSAQCTTPLLEMIEFKAEKVIQSVCHHNPPCEFVRGCYKQKYEPVKMDSYIQFPVRDNIQRRDVQKDEVSEHSTQCSAIAECRERNIILTATGNVTSQVKGKMDCCHKPPCILIPTCLARMVYDNYISTEALPNCVHYPQCGLIPACCRKPTKATVSVSSQYPSGCRVV